MKKLLATITNAVRKTKPVRAAHMTFVRSGLSMSITRTGLLLRRQIWLWPIIAFVLLSLVGFSVRSAIESTMKANLQSELETLLRVEVAMLENWYEVQISHTDSVANDQTVRQLIYPLLTPSSTAPADDSTERIKAGLALKKELQPLLQVHHHDGYIIFDREQRIAAASNDDLVGLERVEQYQPFLTRVLAGQSTVSAPMTSMVLLRNADGQLQSNMPTMFACSPVRDSDFQVVGAIALRIRPEDSFTKILQLGRLGSSGETYAFNREGMMVSNSRFDHDLILAGLLPDVADSRSILNLLLRDPGGDMTAGFRPKQRRAEMPMTKMAESATSGKSGVDVSGYNDYRGVPVVGTWVWLPPYDIGVATEIDRAEAFRPLTILQWTFWSLYTLLILSSVTIFAFTLVVARVRREAQNAAVEARQLGQYRLENKLGAGAMGVVYKGYHAMMRRPTAIKLLNIDVMNDTAIERFEHEVQITCRLNHPNTIAIYDYGRTPEGVFYYAMEYLDGIDLQTLVETYGPQCEARAIRILLQICGSLYEAHAQGLVHRDIKPANIMLNRRGGESDVVKVLDFGLVKSVDSAGKSGEALAGTPLYLSPEAIQSPALVDACSDLYAVGAVGYFLVTGKTVFEASTLRELLQSHLTEPPVPPSVRAGVKLSPEFEHAILSCLEKSRARRPQTAHALVSMLMRCPTAGTWTSSDADAWWATHDRKQSGSNNSGQASIVVESDKNEQTRSTVKELSFDQTMMHE